MRWKSATPSSPEVASLREVHVLDDEIDFATLAASASPSSGVLGRQDASPCSDSSTSSAVRTASLSSMMRMVGMRDADNRRALPFGGAGPFLDDVGKYDGDTSPWRESSNLPIGCRPGRPGLSLVLYGSGRDRRRDRRGTARGHEHRELAEDPQQKTPPITYPMPSLGSEYAELSH